MSTSELHSRLVTPQPKMGTTESELVAIIKDLGLGSMFLGTYDKSFPGFINKRTPCCAIVNTGSRDSGGVHWLAMAWYPPSAVFYMFDPFGFSDAKLLQMYNFQYESLLKRSAIHSTPDRCVTLVKSVDTIQGPYSAACGLYCCLFLYSFSQYPLAAMDGNPIIDIVIGVANNKLKDPSAQPLLKANQDAMYTFLAQHSAFFRSRREDLQSKTAFNMIK